MTKPTRGEIWFVSLDPTQGGEQAGNGPALIVSVDPFNHGPAELTIAVPVTSKFKGVPFHVQIDPPEGGLNQTSFAKCEDVRSVSTTRLTRKLGSVSSKTMHEVEDKLRVLLGL